MIKRAAADTIFGKVCHLDKGEITQVAADNSGKSELFLSKVIFYMNNIFSFVLIQKKQKIKPQYFYPKNQRTYFPIATPAARASHSTRGPLPAANA